METLIIILIIGSIYFFLFNKTTTVREKNHNDYIDLGDNCWFTPGGFVDLTPRLTLEQELHNQNNEREIRRRDERFKMECAMAEHDMYMKQYQLMKDKVDVIPPLEKLEVWLPKWIDYVCDWHIKEKNRYEEIYGYMRFDVFIATEIIPFKGYGMKLVFKKPVAQIEYVV